MTSVIKEIQTHKKTKKAELGQFYTKNFKYILQNIKVPSFIRNIIEPFAGEGDLLTYLKNNYKEYNIEAYDIEPKQDNILKRDTLLNPPSYKNKYIVTNPPYLARNKSNNKQIYDFFQQNDLYKCFLKALINEPSLGGILIIPLNFICSTRRNDVLLRKNFLDIYSIEQLNIFEETVFEDTSTTVCSLSFVNRSIDKSNDYINIDIYPSKINIKSLLTEENNYTIGGDIYNILKTDNYQFKRLTSKNINDQNTHIVIKCIDDNSTSLIRAEYIEQMEKLFVDNTLKCSARGYLTLIINPPISIKQQKQLVSDFNLFLNKKRQQYHSLFLANYRESKDIARKRISFELVYKIIGYLIS